MARQLFVLVLAAVLAMAAAAAEGETRSVADAVNDLFGIVEIDMPREERDLQSVPSGCNYGWNTASSTCCSRLCSSNSDCYLEYSYSGRVTYQCSYRFGMGVGVFSFIVLYWGLFLLMLIATICCLRRREQHLPESMRTLKKGTIFMWVLATLCCGGIGFAVMLCVVVTRMNHNLRKYSGHQKRHQNAFPSTQQHQFNQHQYQQSYPQGQQGQQSVPVAEPVPQDGDNDRKQNQAVSMV